MARLNAPIALVMCLAFAPSARAQPQPGGAGGLGAPPPGAGATRVEEQTTTTAMAEPAEATDIPPSPSDPDSPTRPGTFAEPSQPQPPHRRVVVGVDPGIATRLRVLEMDLGTLAGRAGGGVVDGVLALVTGGLLVGIGAAANDDLISPYFYVYGAASVAQGIVHLFVVSDPEDAAIALGHMPMESPEDARLRLEFGETSLESIARSSRIARLLDAGIDVATGLAVIPVYLGPNDYELASAMDYFVLIGSGFAIVRGLISFFSRSEAERRWTAYAELRARLEHRTP